MKFGFRIQPICLPQIDSIENFDHKLVQVTGWGQTSAGDKFNNGTEKNNVKNSRLRSVKLLSFNSSTCLSLDTIFLISSSESNFDKLMCARPTKVDGENIDACKGDSGGK